MKIYVETDRGKFYDLSTVFYGMARPANSLNHPSHPKGRWVVDFVVPGKLVPFLLKTLKGDFNSREEAENVVKSLFPTLEEYFEAIYEESLQEIPENDDSDRMEDASHQ
jgi:hypothetical protein